MPTIDVNFILCLCAMLVACAVGTFGMVVVCIFALRSSERQAEATAARLQARSLEEHNSVLHPEPVPAPRLAYEDPFEDVCQQAGVGLGDPQAADRAKKWNEHFRGLDQQFTHPMGPGSAKGSPIIPPPPSRIGAE